MFRPLVRQTLPTAKTSTIRNTGTHAFAGLLGLILCIAALSASSTGSAATADTANNNQFPPAVFTNGHHQKMQNKYDSATSQ